MSGRQRIVIVGGGPSGLSAAYHLTSQPGWQDRYEVEVHQLGWRLGGKGATGRDPGAGWRVQEHGIHGFTGFYDTTFRMMRDCYEAAYGADGSGSQGLPGTMETAFVGTDDADLTEVVGGRWHTTPQHLPARDGVPWVGPARLRPREALVGMLEVLLHRGRPRGQDDHTDLLHPGHHHPVRAWFERQATKALHGQIAELLERVAAAVAADVADHVFDALLDEVLDLVSDVGELVDAALEHVHLEEWSSVRLPLIMLDFACALLHGVLERAADGTRLIDRDLDEIDHLEYRDWLRSHGASQVTVTSEFMDATPNILFAYPSGDTSVLPTLSAATFVGWALRMYCILGDTYYLFPAGTGEGVIRPIYLALRDRGVRFRFFSRLEEVVLSEDGHAVDRLRMTQQAEVAAGPYAYEPLVPVPMPSPREGFTAWPAEPVWDQLADGESLREALRVQGTDLESWWCRPPTAQPYDLQHGEDFDVVVLAIPPATFPYVARQLLDRHDRWARLHDRVTTTATLAFQMWIDKPASELGGDQVALVPSHYVTAGWPAPMIGVGEFSDVMRYEAWPLDGTAPQALIYGCGPLADLEDPANLDLSDTTAPGRALARGLATATEWVRGVAMLLPGLAPPPDERVDPRTPDHRLLHAPADVGPVADRRVAAQWVKVNVDPPERYTQAPPGSASARFDAWDTDVTNLVAAGDWIRTGVNAGCFEGAVLGGALASHALTGSPALPDLPDYAFGHPGIDRQVVEPRLARGAT